ncbi:unnamed protein product [Brassica napus]|uniref:(rape) hypothetical protein n=1 Tax=Brassica napus TaxID=3708 RepID=A0A816RRJ3_BRANA|nr:unnamed protein product [Brassica napus]
MWSVRVSFSLNDSGRLFLLCSSLPSEGRWRLTTEDDAPGPHGGDWEIDDSDHPSEQGPSIDDSYHPDFAHLERKKIYEGHAKGADMRPPLVAEVRGFIFSLDYYIEGDMAAEKIPKDVKNLWEEWNIRVLIIFSLSLQSILVVFSPSRKRTSGKLFVFLIWFAYLLADWSANYTIGQISDTQDEEDGDQGWTLCALLAPMNDVRSKRSE